MKRTSPEDQATDRREGRQRRVDTGGRAAGCPDRRARCRISLLGLPASRCHITSTYVHLTGGSLIQPIRSYARAGFTWLLDNRMTFDPPAFIGPDCSETVISEVVSRVAHAVYKRLADEKHPPLGIVFD